MPLPDVLGIRISVIRIIQTLQIPLFPCGIRGLYNNPKDHLLEED